jgi:hypothetical protein
MTTIRMRTKRSRRFIAAIRRKKLPVAAGAEAAIVIIRPS